MSSGSVHQVIAAATVGTACLWAERDQQHKTEKPLIGAVLAAGFTKLPDVLEPALHPHHRQFFHSLTFAGILGLTVHKAYRWQPNNPTDETVHPVGLRNCIFNPPPARCGNPEILATDWQVVTKRK